MTLFSINKEIISLLREIPVQAETLTLLVERAQVITSLRDDVNLNFVLPLEEVEFFIRTFYPVLKQEQIGNVKNLGSELLQVDIY